MQRFENFLNFEAKHKLCDVDFCCKLHFRTCDSGTLAPDTVPLPEADWSSAACLNADVTHRSERAQPSGKLSHFENIPDMITVSVWVGLNQLHPECYENFVGGRNQRNLCPCTCTSAELMKSSEILRGRVGFWICVTCFMFCLQDCIININS